MTLPVRPAVNCTERSLSPNEQFRQFVSALYKENDLIEVRPIEIWTDASSRKRRSRLLHKEHWWLTADELCSAFVELAEFNRTGRANIFLGVNPRPNVGATKKCDVQLCRSVWADMDSVTIEEVNRRWLAIGLPPPSIVVESGHGVHLYWLLDPTYEIQNNDDRVFFESMLRALYLDLGSDAIQDVSRLLRAPGFLNAKNARNGRSMIPCCLVGYDRKLCYSMDVFERWMPTHQSRGVNLMAEQEAFRKSTQAILRLGDNDDSIQSLISCLHKRTKDRSRRDYAVVCGLLRLGISDEKIWRLVHDKSKFRARGRLYFETTIENARRDVFR